MKLKKQVGKANQNDIRVKSKTTTYFIEQSKYKRKPMSTSAALIASDTLSLADLLMAKGHTMRMYATIADINLASMSKAESQSGGNDEI